MKAGELPSSAHSRSRLSLALTIALVVISSSPVIVLDNIAFARPSSSSLSQSHDSIPSTISQSGGDISAQAPLQIPRTLQSTDLTNSLAIYEVTFITSTTGAIDKIRMDFAAGTNINAAGVIEKVGIGGGTLLKAAGSLTYDVTTPVSIPAGTFIRLEIFGIKNPFNPSTSNTATITTRDSAGNLIDGPSVTNVYIIKRIEGNDVAESFMKRVTLLDDPSGHARGWDPSGQPGNGGGPRNFIISESAISSDIDNPFFTVEVVFGVGAEGLICAAGNHDPVGKTFAVSCTFSPPNGSELHYVVGNLPGHLICPVRPCAR